MRMGMIRLFESGVNCATKWECTYGTLCRVDEGEGNQESPARPARNFPGKGYLECPAPSCTVLHKATVDVQKFRLIEISGRQPSCGTKTNSFILKDKLKQSYFSAIVKNTNLT